MAMSKSDLQSHDEAYHQHLNAATKALNQGMVRPAVASAISAWPFIDGMMQYQRRYEDRDFSSVEAIDIVLRYAPLLLDLPTLDRLQTLLAQRKRIERDTSADMGDLLARARQRTWQNHRLWTYLEEHPEARQEDLARALGDDQEYWRSVVEKWATMGLLNRQPAGRTCTLSLTTRMGQIVPAKCPLCGSRADAPKAMLLTETTCPHCRQGVWFVFLQPPNPKAQEE